MDEKIMRFFCRMFKDGKPDAEEFKHLLRQIKYNWVQK